jgi:type IV secretory pathway VirB4 component
MTNQIEMIVIETDEAPEQTKAQRALFQMQFMQMMLMAGRMEAAEEALEKCTALLNEMIAEGN